MTATPPAKAGEGSDVATPDMTAGGGPPSGEFEPWSERDFAPIVAFLRTLDDGAGLAPAGR